MISKTYIRLVFIIILVLLIGTVSQSVMGAESSTSQINKQNSIDWSIESSQAADQITVITTQSTGTTDAKLLAVNASGDVLYQEHRYQHYYDVDPVEGQPLTVEVMAMTDVFECASRAGEDRCQQQIIDQVNLRTGERTRLYSEVRRPKSADGWHDFDRVGSDRLLIADIYNDQVYIVNTTTGIVDWMWTAQAEYNTSSGSFVSDWTHLNDVEQLIDGRVMVSMRNQDEVVFIDPQTGVDDHWTLGEDDNHEILYEQHNPDYIRPVNGGPAVIVGDSENNRVVEYQRVNESWERSWVWSDTRMQWPRDADRLPNNHTLITDSNGDRVFEVNEQGDIVWEFDVKVPYEAERLGTGDESAGGHAAALIGLQSQGVVRDPNELPRSEMSKTSISNELILQARSIIPGPIVNGVLHVLPRWMSLYDILSILGVIGVMCCWIILEFRWAGGRVRSPITYNADP